MDREGSINFESASRNSPFDGWKLKGRAVRTIVERENGLEAVAADVPAAG